MNKLLRKIAELRATLEKMDLDAILITNPYNRRYMTNFTGSSGVVFITNSKSLLITDFRYIEQATEQATEFTIVEHKGPIEEELTEIIKKTNIKKLGFEEGNITYAEYALFKDKFPVHLVPVKNIVESIRVTKTDEEITVLKQAAQIADNAFDHILSYIKPGVREIDIANELEFFMRKQGATSSSFDIIVASGYRSVLPHGVASEKTIESGELVTLDYGALFKGYCSDITRTIAVGYISEELQKIYHIVLEAQKRGVKGIKPNMSGKEADALTRDYIEAQGYGKYFGHSTGHGIGLEVHEGPTLSKRSDIILKKNMVVTVEPGIYIPELGGCRIEDDIVITEEGNERLTTATKELIYVE